MSWQPSSYISLSLTGLSPVQLCTCVCLGALSWPSVLPSLSFSHVWAVSSLHTSKYHIKCTNTVIMNKKKHHQAVKRTKSLFLYLYNFILKISWLLLKKTYILKDTNCHNFTDSSLGIYTSWLTIKHSRCGQRTKWFFFSGYCLFCFYVQQSTWLVHQQGLENWLHLKSFHLIK